jgi:nucleoside-triphosphatase THEP1
MKEMSSRSERRPVIFILTGDVHAGKTTWLRQFVQKLRARSLRYHGFLSAAVIEGGRTVGYTLYDLESQSSSPYLRENGEDGWERTGPFFFVPSGLARAGEIIARREADSLLIVDEVGPVELVGRGIWPALERVLRRRGRVSLLVIRKSILEDLLKILPRERVRVFEFSVENAGGRLLDEIAGAMAKEKS